MPYGRLCRLSAQPSPILSNPISSAPLAGAGAKSLGFLPLAISCRLYLPKWYPCRLRGSHEPQEPTQEHPKGSLWGPLSDRSPVGCPDQYHIPMRGRREGSPSVSGWSVRRQEGSLKFSSRSVTHPRCMVWGSKPGLPPGSEVLAASWALSEEPEQIPGWAGLTKEPTLRTFSNPR